MDVPNQYLWLQEGNILVSEYYVVDTLHCDPHFLMYGSINILLYSIKVILMERGEQ